MAHPHDICIRGAGIVGRALALFLARERWRVALVHAPVRADAPPDVRAYALNEAARHLLQELRCWPEDTAVTPVKTMQVWGDTGQALCFDAHEQGTQALNWMVDVPALEARLATAVDFQPLIDQVTQPVPAALTIVCEGRASQTRAELGVPFDVTAYPQHALAARLICERPHDAIARQWFGFGDAPGQSRQQSEVLALLPLGGATGHEVALVWSVHPSRAQALQALDEAAFADTLARACHQALGHMRLSSPRACWPLQLARAARWCGAVPGTQGQSFALAGDAAHAMHPLAGQGLNVGLGDVAELVRVIRAKEYWRPLHDLRLLRRYERARQADVLSMGLLTDGLQRLFSLPGQRWSALRNGGLSALNRSGPIKHWLTRRAMGVNVH